MIENRAEDKKEDVKRKRGIKTQRRGEERKRKVKTREARKREERGTNRCVLMFLYQEALGSLHHGGVGSHEGHRILLDLITVEQSAPTNNQQHKTTGNETNILVKQPTAQDR